jgi:hypothetical protein
LPPAPSEDDDPSLPPKKAVLKDATLLKLWAIAFGAPGRVYVGTIPGGLFVSQNGGESHSIVIDPRNPDRVLVAVSTAGVLETTDGGKTWRSRNKGLQMDYQPDPNAEWGHDPHSVELCSGAPDHVWQQNHCGVFYSSDGAASWKKVIEACTSASPWPPTRTTARRPG